MPSDYLDLITVELERLQLDLTYEQKQILSLYCSELERWNEKINLTALRDAELVRRLVAEPVWIAKQLQPTGVLIDIGSGNGSPAIPIHVVSNLTTTHLVEARAKRAAFLRHIVSTLALKGIEVHRERFEDVPWPPLPVDWITLQAVGWTAQLADSIKQIATKTTNVVWITAGADPPVKPLQRLIVPDSRTEIFVFNLDHS